MAEREPNELRRSHTDMRLLSTLIVYTLLGKKSRSSSQARGVHTLRTGFQCD